MNGNDPYYSASYVTSRWLKCPLLLTSMCFFCTACMPDLEPKDLLDLPEDATTLLRGGVYLDVLGRYGLDQIERRPHPDYHFFKTDSVRSLKSGVLPASAEEFRLYGGSSILNVPLRLHTHILEMNRPEDDKKQPECAHYAEFGNSPDVVSHFRLTSAWDQSDDRRFPVLFEGLLITYLGLQTDGKTGEHHPAETYELNRELRQGLDLPDTFPIS